MTKTLRGANYLTALITFGILGLYTLHRTHIFFFLLHKSSTDEMRTLKQQCTNNYCSWSLSHRSFE